ncbi:MAG: pantothenate kinase [Defluviitaleaceae bacterium]|nr:pantothenate kinase [Defluviitaleaceae bacterium]MCL2275568.1 pantothenate kinase [Defluviitaleaceae bacterium]
MILGIDVGGSTTKIIGLTSQGECIGMMQVEASDQTASAFGAFGKFTALHGLRIPDIKQIALTGVGAPYLSQGMYDIPTRRVEEFLAIGLGGLRMADLDNALIISAGTGTALVRAEGKQITHIGGSGVGGGTLLKMAARFAGASCFATITELASKGDLRAVDLRLGDISAELIGKLSPTTTVANFGNLKDNATTADIILGLINMIFESIGTMAVFASLGSGVQDIVLIGALSAIQQAGDIFKGLEALYPVRFHIPPNAIYATAMGAGLSVNRG